MKLVLLNEDELQKWQKKIDSNPGWQSLNITLRIADDEVGSKYQLPLLITDTNMIPGEIGISLVLDYQSQYFSK